MPKIYVPILTSLYGVTKLRDKKENFEIPYLFPKMTMLTRQALSLSLPTTISSFPFHMVDM